MSRIDRRQLLASLAIGSIGANVVRDGTEPAAGKPANNDRGRWFIARERLQRSDQYTVEFWSTPAYTITYADQLPQQIVRRAIWPERDALRVDPIAQLRWLRGDLEILEFNGSESLLQWLSSDGETPCRRGKRTALLALDGASRAGQPWSEILPAFRRSYDHMIGHFHIAQRGFLHWKAARLADGLQTSDFEKFFTAITSQCDGVIFSNQSLVENDSYLSARAATEMLAGELMRRFGEVLLDERLLTQIVPARNMDDLYPCAFALGSAGASAFSPRICMRDLTRQRELVFSSFGRPILHPLLIATCVSQHCAESIQNQLVGSNIKLFKTATSADPNGNGEFLEWFKFATLWPFDWSYGAWP